MCYEKNSQNVLGTDLIPCSLDPLTGYTRDGFCKQHKLDHGNHIVCAVVDNAFLSFSKNRGNDLITPIPEYSFKGLKEGDSWCLCADRWIEALNNGFATSIVLEATHENLLKKIEFSILKKYGVELKNLN